MLCHNYVIGVGAVLRDVKIFTPLCRHIYSSLVLYCKTSLTKCALVTRNAYDKINRFTTLKAGFHMIANDCRLSQIVDRRRSQRELFPYDRRRSQTIAEPTVAIPFVQRKCQMYSRVSSRVLLAGKSKQTRWRTSRSKFCCKQIYFFFQS